MVKEPILLEHVLSAVQQLSPNEQLQLISRVAERVMTYVQPKQIQQMIYGQFRGDNPSTEADFAIAEWRPTEQELNGA